MGIEDGIQTRQRMKIDAEGGRNAQDKEKSEKRNQEGTRRQRKTGKTLLTSTEGHREEEVATSLYRIQDNSHFGLYSNPVLQSSSSISFIIDSDIFHFYM